MTPSVVVIGSGLSGLAAAIRVARFSPNVILVEKHIRVGGLNSYYHRQGVLFETGLHAITNYAEPGDKQAPLNRLLRQLKLKRSQLTICQQHGSEICFPGFGSLRFDNDFALLTSEVGRLFPDNLDAFIALTEFVKDYDPFAPAPFVSTRAMLTSRGLDPLLIEMLLCPVFYYGSSVPDDVDISQFVIMFRALYLEGLFRPLGSIRELLDLLVTHFRELGGRLVLGAEVVGFKQAKKRVLSVLLKSGEEMPCQAVLSTIGHQETLNLLGCKDPNPPGHERLGFVESIYLVGGNANGKLPKDRSIIFFNQGKRFSYCRPESPVDYRSGVICFPQNFSARPPEKLVEVRATHLANPLIWKELAREPESYRLAKGETAKKSAQVLEEIVGPFQDDIEIQDTFTPVTIERFTGKIEGAIYGSPGKVKDGNLGFDNLFLAGTDQGFMGIVGSMLSGVSIVNQHILARLT